MPSEEPILDGFRPEKTHPHNYNAEHLFKEHPDISAACDRFREYFGKDGYRIDEAEKAVREGSVPSGILDPLYRLAADDRHLLCSFLPGRIVAALRGEEFIKRKKPYHRKKS